MKTIRLFVIALLFAFYSCNTGEKSNAEIINFGIYEIVKINSELDFEYKI